MSFVTHYFYSYISGNTTHPFESVITVLTLQLLKIINLIYKGKNVWVYFFPIIRNYKINSQYVNRKLYFSIIETDFHEKGFVVTSKMSDVSWINKRFNLNTIQYDSGLKNEEGNSSILWFLLRKITLSIARREIVLVFR